METFQNRAEGFEVGEELGFLEIHVPNCASEFANRCHMRRDVVDDEILNLFRSKEREKKTIIAERTEKLHNRIRSFSVDDEILLGDEEISNFFCVVFFVARKRTDGGFELRISGGVSEKTQKVDWIDESE